MRRVLIAAAILAILAVLVGAPMAAQAQEIVAVADIPTTQRQGSIQSSSYTVPVDATGWIRLVADISQVSEYEDTGKSLTLRIYDLRAGVWTETDKARWRGGRYVDPELGTNPMPYVEIYAPHWAGRTLRVELDVPARMRVGAQLQTSPTPIR